MKLPKALCSTLPAILVAAATTLSIPASLRAADHGDAPQLAQDQGADIADVFLFMDPNNAPGATDANKNVILIATFHGFITPGEANNFAIFDPNLQYRFEIFNDHVNRPAPVLGSTKPRAQQARDLARVKANRTIDVTFTRRTTEDKVPGEPRALARFGPQKATVTLTGFTNKPKTFAGLPTVGPTLGDTARDQAAGIRNLNTGRGNIQFFAGEVDDPFFFDIPGFAAFIENLRKRQPLAQAATALARGRDTFAGYNCLAVALKIPLSLVKGTNGPVIGADFLTRRHLTQFITQIGAVGAGPFKTVDRMGNPGVNVALLPVGRKDAYNASGSAQVDASTALFAGDIIAVLSDLGVKTTSSAFGILASIAVAKGDILQLDTRVPNTGDGGGTNAETGFGTAGGGRRPLDDTIDTVLSVIAGGPAGDNVGPDQDGFRPTNAFPFLHTPHQPKPVGTLDDGTRN